MIKTTGPQPPRQHGREEWPVYMAVIFAVWTLISVVVCFIGTIYPDWAHGDVTFATIPPSIHERRVGLWHVCGHVQIIRGMFEPECRDYIDYAEDNCNPLVTHIRVLQALAVVACLSLVLATCLLPAGVAFFLGPLTAVGLLAILIGFLSTLVTLVMFVDKVFDVDWPCMSPKTKTDVPRGALGIGWALMLVACIMSMFGVLFSVYLFFYVLRRNNRAALAQGDQPLGSPVGGSPTTGGVGRDAPLDNDDPLLTRVDAVKIRLRRTLLADTNRMMKNQTPSPTTKNGVGLYVPPVLTSVPSNPNYGFDLPPLTAGLPDLPPHTRDYSPTPPLPLVGIAPHFYTSPDLGMYGSGGGQYFDYGPPSPGMVPPLPLYGSPSFYGVPLKY